MNRRSDERGVVSIITVMFFVVLLSILTVAFLRIMSDEQSQVIGDDLTKGALASARSGVEDAKRALLYCRTLPAGPEKVNCEAALSTTQCPGIFGAPTSGTMRTALGVTTTSAGVQVGGNPELNQRYTCLKIVRDTLDVIGVAQEDIGDLIELNTSSLSFDTITLRWHRLDSKYDGAAGLDSQANTKINPHNPQTPDWKNASTNVSYPALLRVQILEYDPAANLTTLANKQITAYFVPTNNGSSSVGPAGLVATSSSLHRSRNFAACTTTGDYSCNVSITGLTINPLNRYFLRVSTKYRTANYKVELRTGGASGAIVPLHDVQPAIDSTGAASDVYRRIITRVKYGIDGFYTDNALESGGSLCKAFYVTNEGRGTLDACSGL